MLTNVYKIIQQRDTKAKGFVFGFCSVLFLCLGCPLSFADDPHRYSPDKAMDILERVKKKIAEGKELCGEEWRALEILHRSQQKSRQQGERRSSIGYPEREPREITRYKTIDGTQPALGVVVEDHIVCEQKLMDNKDGLTFTYMRRTKEGYTEKWVFLKNANPFYWANYWEDIDKKLDELDKVESHVRYQLPPSKVLIEIIKLSKICPFEVSSITGTDIKIFNTETVIPYWTNEEYFFTDSETTQYAVTVSLYYARRGSQNKNNFAIIWPCYLKSRTQKEGSS